MAVAAVASEASPPQPQSMDHAPSPRVSTSSSSSGASSADRRSFSHSYSSKQFDTQNQPSLKSEEYRQLFRLPPDEGHMYLFDHYICFYSNLIGFETKRIIPFHEVTSVRRAKAAVIFPTAIEIIAGGNKYFFTSLLSRDEAFKLINDGWMEHSNGAKSITDQQESSSEISSPENGITIVEKAQGSRQLVDEFDLVDRDEDVSISEVSELPANVEPEIASSSGIEANVEEDAEILRSTECSPSGNSLVWKEEDSDAPRVPECYTLVAEYKFSIKVEEFFSLFLSDDGVGFQESFHKKCGDKEFRCTSWCAHEKFGHTRDVSFQHPIKLYFGARFGSCQEVQKYRVYRNSHLILETSQEISDVPYGDYFRVEGLWDVQRDTSESKEGCIFRVYTNVAFSKKTIWKGKIVQSTVEECQEAYAIWIDLAHELLKRKNLEEEAQVHLERRAKVEEYSKSSHDGNDSRLFGELSDPMVVNQLVINNPRDSLSAAPPVASSFIDSMAKLGSSLRGQSVLLVITIAVILLLMQISILVLLSRPQQIHVIPQGDRTSSFYKSSEIGAETVALLEKQIYHLKEEMLMVETLLDKMRQEHALLRFKLKDFELHRKSQI